MVAETVLAEFRDAWLPHISDSGLDRLIGLLETASPFLIHGAFSRCLPMGCLATHVAWNHPATEHLQVDAGILWLTRIAKLNPATSKVILAWDRIGVNDWELRDALLSDCRRERTRREEHFQDVVREDAEALCC